MNPKKCNTPIKAQSSSSADLDQSSNMELHDAPVPSTEAKNGQNADDLSPEYEINEIIKGRYNKDGKVEYLIH